MLRVSFFANNMFRSYPRRESKRNPGSYIQLNNRFFFWAGIITHFIMFRKL